MTRGKIIYINNDSQVFATCEFNGDMHPQRYGEDVLEGFKISQVSKLMSISRSTSTSAPTFSPTVQVAAPSSKDSPFISNLRHEGKDMILRIVSDNMPGEQAVPCEATLEDLYLYYFPTEERGNPDSLGQSFQLIFRCEEIIHGS